MDLPPVAIHNDRRLLNQLGAEDYLSHTDRIDLYRQFGLIAGAKVSIASGCFFTHTDLSTVQLGNDVFINHDVYFDNGGAIVVGNGVDIGDHVRLLTGTHAIGSSAKRAGYGCVRKAISIGDGCWLGSSVVVLPGCAIGSGAVIGAGAIVNGDCEADWLYCGVPARKVRRLS